MSELTIKFTVPIFKWADPTIKVTFLGKGLGVRCINPDGTLFDEQFVKTRLEIGPTARDMLRQYDKMGPTLSKYADKARHRPGIKEGRLKTGE